MIAKQKRWGKKVIYARNWRKINESYVKRAVFYLDFEWVKNWSNEIIEMNKGNRKKFIKVVVTAEPYDKDLLT